MNPGEEITIETLGLNDPNRARTFILTARLCGKEFAGQFNLESDESAIWVAKRLYQSMHPNQETVFAYKKLVGEEVPES